MFGTEAAKERYLPPVTAGEDAIAIAISEPEAGSDVGSMRTTVEADGDELVVNGEKTWVSNVPHASAVVVWVRFPEGLGSLVVEFDWPSVEIQQHYTNMAGHTQTHFYLEDVVVPAENVLTRGEDGFKRQLQALNWERLGSATLANAFGRCALDRALDYAEDREQFGQPSASSRASSGSSRTWSSAWRRRGRSPTARRGTPTSRDVSPTGSTPRWRNCSRARPSSTSSARRCRSTVRTATSRDTRWSTSTASPAAAGSPRALMK